MFKAPITDEDIKTISCLLHTYTSCLHSPIVHIFIVFIDKSHLKLFFNFDFRNQLFVQPALWQFLSLLHLQKHWRLLPFLRRHHCQVKVLDAQPWRTSWRLHKLGFSLLSDLFPWSWSLSLFQSISELTTFAPNSLVKIVPFKKLNKLRNKTVFDNIFLSLLFFCTIGFLSRSQPFLLKHFFLHFP